MLPYWSLLLLASTSLTESAGVWTTDCRLLATQRLDPIGMRGPPSLV